MKLLVLLAGACMSLAATAYAADLSEEALKGKTTVQVMMQNKINATNELFEALINKDYGTVEHKAKILGTISTATTWHRPNDPEFKHYAKSFQESIDSMLENVKQRNYEGMAMSYFRLTLSCMYCHNNVRFDDPKYKEGIKAPKK